MLNHLGHPFTDTLRVTDEMGRNIDYSITHPDSQSDADYDGEVTHSDDDESYPSESELTAVTLTRPWTRTQSFRPQE